MVPLDAEHTVLDWIAALRAPAVLVVGSYLGTLSHTLTAAAVLRERGCALAAVIVSESTRAARSARRDRGDDRKVPASDRRRRHAASRVGGDAALRRCCRCSRRSSAEPQRGASVVDSGSAARRIGQRTATSSAAPNTIRYHANGVKRCARI